MAMWLEKMRLPSIRLRSMQVLDKTAKFEAAFIVGFNELRGHDLYNTAMVVHKGHVLRALQQVLGLHEVSSSGTQVSSL